MTAERALLLLALTGFLCAAAVSGGTRAVFARATTGVNAVTFKEGVAYPSEEGSCAVAVERVRGGVVRDYRPCCPTGFVPVGLDLNSQVICLEE